MDKLRLHGDKYSDLTHLERGIGSQEMERGPHMADGPAERDWVIWVKMEGKNREAHSLDPHVLRAEYYLVVQSQTWHPVQIQAYSHLMFVHISKHHDMIYDVVKPWYIAAACLRKSGVL